jgi:hypothetical protein
VLSAELELNLHLIFPGTDWKILDARSDEAFRKREALELD